MNKSEDNASESDLSDEDFCPENEATSELSEVSSDDEIEDDGNTAEVDYKVKKKGRKSKKKSTNSKPINKQSEGQLKRSTRHKAETNEANEKKTEKDELESDDEEKARADSLWADFLGDVKQTIATDGKEKKKELTKIEKSPSRKPHNATTTTSTNGDKSNGKATEIGKEELEMPKKITITEIMDFAGEEIKVQKVVSPKIIKENKTSSPESKPTTGLKRTTAASSSGLGSILNQIGKKRKISVLEKTKLDWNSFKQDQGIDEELQTFNKGKDGYLERQDFLERTDVRQFEIERNLRQTRRNH